MKQTYSDGFKMFWTLDTHGKRPSATGFLGFATTPVALGAIIFSLVGLI